MRHAVLVQRRDLADHEEAERERAVDVQVELGDPVAEPRLVDVLAEQQQRADVFAS